MMDIAEAVMPINFWCCRNQSLDMPCYNCFLFGDADQWAVPVMWNIIYKNLQCRCLCISHNIHNIGIGVCDYQTAITQNFVEKKREFVNWNNNSRWNEWLQGKVGGSQEEGDCQDAIFRSIRYGIWVNINFNYDHLLAVEPIKMARNLFLQHILGDYSPGGTMYIYSLGTVLSHVLKKIITYILFFVT